MTLRVLTSVVVKSLSMKFSTDCACVTMCVTSACGGCDVTRAESGRGLRSDVDLYGGGGPRFSYRETASSN